MTGLSALDSYNAAQGAACGQGRVVANNKVCQAVRGTALELYDQVVTSDDLEALFLSFPHLTRLQLMKCSLDDTCAKVLSKFKKLTSVDLSANFKITDAGVAFLTSLTQLQSVVLDYCSVSDVGLKSLKKLSSLQVLSVRNTLVTGDGLKPLSRKLEVFKADGCREVTDAKVSRGLSNKRSLRQLQLSGTSVTGRTLPILSQTVEEVHMRSCQAIDKRAVSRFQNRRPDTRIID